MYNDQLLSFSKCGAMKKFGYHERFKKEDVNKVLKEGSKYGI